MSSLNKTDPACYKKFTNFYIKFITHLPDAAHIMDLYCVDCFSQV